MLFSVGGPCISYLASSFVFCSSVTCFPFLDKLQHFVPAVSFDPLASLEKIKLQSLAVSYMDISSIILRHCSTCITMR